MAINCNVSELTCAVCRSKCIPDTKKRLFQDRKLINSNT